MEELHYVINSRKLIIYYPVDESGQYRVEWEGYDIGYLYISVVCENLGTPVWEASSDRLALFKEELGEFIESSNL